MTVSFRAKSTTAAYSTGSPGVVLPAGIQAGDGIYILVGTKPDTAGPASATGYTNIGAFTGGTGTTGIDTGPTRIGVLFKEADGSESGATVTVSVPSNNVSWAYGWVLSRTLGAWDNALVGGNDTTGASAAYSATSASNPGVTTGDYVIAACCIPTDACTVAVDGALTNNLTQTGVTFGTAQASGNLESSAGNDIGGHVRGVPVSSGTGSANLVYTVTFTGSTNTYGPTAFVRVRDVTAVAGACTAGTSAHGTAVAVDVSRYPARPKIVTRTAVQTALQARRPKAVVRVSATRQDPPVAVAKNGAVAAGSSAHGTAVKKATTTGACAAGTFARGTAVKKAPTTSTAAAGASAHGTAVKKAPTTGAGAIAVSAFSANARVAAVSSVATVAVSGHGVTTKAAPVDGAAAIVVSAAGTASTGAVAADQYPARPAVATRAAQAAAQRAYRRLTPGLVKAAPAQPAAAAAQSGAATTGTATYGTTVKKASVAGACTASVAAAGSTGVVVATRPPTQPLVVTRTAVAARRSFQPPASVMFDSGPPELVVAGAQTGRAATAAAAHGTARKVATVAGRAAAAASAVSTAAKRATGQGRSYTGVAAHATSGAIVPRSVTAVSTAGVAAAGVAAKRAATTGGSVAAISAQGNRGPRPVAGTATTGGFARASARKTALPTGTGTAAVTAAGSARKRGQLSAATLAALSCSGSPGKRSPVGGRAVVGVVASSTTSLRDIGGRCYVGGFARARAWHITLQPHTGTTLRPDTGQTTRPFTGITYRHYP